MSSQKRDIYMKDDVDLALSTGWLLNPKIEEITEMGIFSSNELLEAILNRFITHIQTSEVVILSTENDYGGGFSSPSDEEREEWCNSFIDNLRGEEKMSVTRRRLEDCARYEIIKVEKSSIPQGAVLIEAYETDKEYLIVGQPKNEEGLPEEGRHNCDEMGCGCCHIIRRFSKE